MTARNAELEGVVDRVELVTGDLRELPFKPEDFARSTGFGYR